MRVTEEEWTEQVLNFEHYKRRGPMYLDKAFTQVGSLYRVFLGGGWGVGWGVQMEGQKRVIAGDGQKSCWTLRLEFCEFCEH